MRTVVFSTLLSFFFLPPVFSEENALVAGANKKMDYEKFLGQMLELRGLWLEFQDIPLPQQKHDVLREKCRILAQSEKYHYPNGILDFIRGGCDSLFHRYAIYRRYLSSCNPPMELESFYEMFPRSYADIPRDGLEVNSISLDLIPMAGSVGNPLNFPIKFVWDGTYHWERSMYVPSEYPSMGDSLKSLGYYEEAYHAYLEMAYVGRNRDNIRPYLVNTAPLWLDVAECNYRLGKKDLAWSYLMKVGVFGTEQHMGQVKEIAKFWIQCEEEGVGLPEPKKLTKEERQKIAEQIVRGYMEVNAHPRAWAFIERHPEDFSAPEKLKKEVQDAWLAFVNSLIEIAKNLRDPKVIVYNQQIYPDGIDPLEVKIPWAFSEGSIERAKAMLREAMRISLLESEPRIWYSDGGEIEHVAKFISADETHVTLELLKHAINNAPEQTAGEVITRERSKLMPDDQDYVHWRLEAEKNPVDVPKPASEEKILDSDNENKESAKPAVEEVPDAEMRTWRSPDGDYEVKAKFVRGDAATIFLEREDGVTIRVQVALLCAADQEYVKQRLSTEKDKLQQSE